MFWGILTYITKKIISVYKIFWGRDSYELEEINAYFYYLSFLEKNKPYKPYPSLLSESKLTKVNQIIPKLPDGRAARLKNTLVKKIEGMSYEEIVNYLKICPKDDFREAAAQVWLAKLLERMRSCVKTGNILEYQHLHTVMLKITNVHMKKILEIFLKSQKAHLGDVSATMLKKTELNLIKLKKVEYYLYLNSGKKLKFKEIASHIEMDWHLQEVSLKFSKLLDKRLELQHMQISEKLPSGHKGSYMLKIYIENQEYCDKLVWKPVMLDIFEKVMSRNREALLEKEFNRSLWTKVLNMDMKVCEKSIMQQYDAKAKLDLKSFIWTKEELVKLKQLCDSAEDEKKSVELLEWILNWKWSEDASVLELSSSAEGESVEYAELEEEGVIEAICLYVLENFLWI